MKKFLFVLAIIAVAYAAWYLGSPLFIDTIVDEDFPVVSDTMTDEDAAMMKKLEKMTPEEVLAMSDDDKAELEEEMKMIGDKMPDVMVKDDMPEAMQPTGPTLLSSGTFQGADRLHKGSGKVSVYALANANSVVRFEDFSVTNGPALSVYLTKLADGDPADGFVDLGKLKGNQGNQNYTIPAGIDLSEYNGISIWCVPFGVNFATARLQ